MSTHDALKRVAGRTIDLVLVCLVVALAIRFFTGGTLKSASSTPELESVRIEEWAELEAIAVPRDSVASVRVIAFVDYQCEFCHRMHALLDSLEVVNPGRLSVASIPFPLRQHSHSVAAANAAQCAAEQGRFKEFEREAYQAQPQIGILPMDSLAMRAGVSDITRFRACLEIADTLPAVKRGLALASSLGLRGTPSLVVNGRLLTSIPTTAALSEHLSALMRTSSPR